MDEVLNNFIYSISYKYTSNQVEELKHLLVLSFNGYDVVRQEKNIMIPSEEQNQKLITMFLIAKKVEGCTNKTISFYKGVLNLVFTFIAKPIIEVNTNDIRCIWRKGPCKTM